MKFHTFPMLNSNKKDNNFIENIIINYLEYLEINKYNNNKQWHW